MSVSLLEAIHPFIDGNGRVGRLLVVLLLIECGLLSAPLLDLSAYIEPRRDRYYNALMRVSTHGDWLNWFEFFLEAVERQARDSLARARQLLDLRTQMRARLATTQSSALPARLVDALFYVPMVTVAGARTILEVTHRAAAMNVEKLVSHGFLREVTPRRRPKLFVADAILKVVEAAQLP